MGKTIKIWSNKIKLFLKQLKQKIGIIKTKYISLITIFYAKLKYFLTEYKWSWIISFWFVNLYLFNRMFGDILGIEMNWIITVIGGIGIMFERLGWTNYWEIKFGLPKLFLYLGIFTIIHFIITLYIFKPIKLKVLTNE